MTGILETIIAKGNRAAFQEPGGRRGPGRILCEDGFHVSVIAGSYTYCLPRNAPGPYTHLEVGFPSSKPKPWLDASEFCWSKYADDNRRATQTVYGYVPVAMVAALLASHGGAIAIFDSVEELLVAIADRKIVRE